MERLEGKQNKNHQLQTYRCSQWYRKNSKSKKKRTRETRRGEGRCSKVVNELEMGGLARTTGGLAR